MENLTLSDGQKTAMVNAVESNVRNLQNLDMFVNIFGRTRKFFLCSDEFIQRAYDYLVRKGAIK